MQEACYKILALFGEEAVQIRPYFAYGSHRNHKEESVGRWFNLIGFVMLFSALFLNELVYLNVWYGSNLFLIVVSLAYLGTATWLSVRSTPSHQPA